MIRRSRYQHLLEDVLQSGVRTKVLLLSATPVNTDLKDLRNQMAFITEGRDEAFRTRWELPASRKPCGRRRAASPTGRSSRPPDAEPETC